MADEHVMGLGVRTRLLLWLGLALLPIAVVTWFAVGVIDERLSERIELDLENVRRLEAARISGVLHEYERDAASLAAGPHVKTFVRGVAEARAGVATSDQVIGGVDDFDVIDPASKAPLDQLAQRLLGKANTTGSEVVGIGIVGLDGRPYGQSPGFTWVSYDDTVINRAIEGRAPVFGAAYRARFSGERLGVVAPVLSGGAVFGALLLETRLGPIVDLVERHEGFGDTSEAHIAQATSEGDAEFITLLRFERDAAFTKVVPKEKQLPINRALESPGGQIVRSPDYRGVDSILAIETIDASGWGLVVKIDRSEAFAPIDEVERIAAIGAVAVAMIVLIGWLLLARPIGRRLRRTAAAAERVASGEYQSLIGDESTDEIGDMARSIDRLAADLDADIQKRSRAEESLIYQASHDELTDLYNRKYAAELIQKVFGPEGPTTSSVLFLDLDGFKAINDAHGHAVGDEALISVAKRLRAAIDQGATVARWGGDEFVVIVPDCDPEGAAAIADRLRHLLRDPIITTAGPQILTFSVGAATSRPGCSIDDVLLEADAKMFAQKQANSSMRKVSSGTRLAVSSALDEGRLEVWYQPIITTPTSGRPRIFGAEALVRLRRAEGQIVLPGEFLPEVEDTALGLALDRWVVASALDDLARWQQAGDVEPGLLLALNFGGASMRDAGLPEFLANEATQRDLSLAAVLVEVPEDVAKLDFAVVNELYERGATIALDDFGSSRSNLDRLVDMEAGVVKIDRRWTQSITAAQPTEEMTILGQVVAMCRDLGVDLVAEGVETEQQLTVLQALGVRAFQGFYFERPQPAEIFEKVWLSGGPREVAR